MAAPTNTFTTGSAIGIREDLHDRIFMLDKDETPFLSSIGSGTAKQTYSEWQTDSLGNGSSSNYNNEGDDTTAVAVTPTVRVGNRTQIMKKAFTISGSLEASTEAGRKSEIGLQTMKQGRQIKMDLETTLLLNQASSGSDPRKLGGILSWLTTNTNRGTSGANGGFSSGNTTAATNGTQRTFTETLLKAGMLDAFNAGGRPTVILLDGTHKQIASGFAGIATQYQQAQGKVASIIAAADRYVGDFGTYTIVADRYTSSRDCIGFDPRMNKVLWFRKFKREELAKTGDARKFHIIGEMTLEVSNEAANFVVADLT
jgi:hypothetical protein